MVVFLQNSDRTYRILLVTAEIFGLISVILVGLLFDSNFYTSTYNWTTNPFSYHPLLMTIGLLFCYGNAIILYRTFQQTPKRLLKILHAIFLLASLTVAAVGFAAIIRSKNLGKRPHFLSFHAWLGLATLILFALQWICGFISFLVPKLSLDARRKYMPSHRLWGKIIFLSALISILAGLSEHGMTSSFFTQNDTQQARRFIMNFFGIVCCLFSLIIIYLLSTPEYQRPAEENPEK